MFNTIFIGTLALTLIFSLAIPKEVTDSIQASQRLIIIYSSHLLEAEWFELTLSLALELSVPLLFITTEDVPSSIPSRTVRAAYKVRMGARQKEFGLILI